MCLIISSAQDRTTSQSRSRQRIHWLFSIQMVSSWPVPVKLSCHSPLPPYFPKMTWRRGGKSQVLIYIGEGKKFFNQTRDDGGEQIKLKVIKAPHSDQSCTHKQIPPESEQLAAAAWKSSLYFLLFNNGN